MTETLKRLGARAWDLATRHAQATTPGGQVVTRVGMHYLTTSPAPSVPDRDTLVPAWAAAGDLTWSQAEALYLLDVTTPWKRSVSDM